MEIRWHCYLFINCAVLIPYLAAKTFSLNKAIAGESYPETELEKHDQASSSSKIKENTGERFSLNKALTSVPVKSQRIKITDINRKIFPLDKITNPLKYRKTFQIKSPLKPKRLKYVLKPWNKRKNKSIKRDVNGNEKFNRKYIPLLKSFGMLVDNLLNSDTSESHEIPKNIHKRNRDYTADKKGLLCTCAHKSTTKSQETKSDEETITSTTTFTSDASTATEAVVLSETTATPTNYTTTSDVSGLRQNKNLSILFPRNTFSGWRDYNGHSERSSTTHNWNSQRNITGNYGNGEHHTSAGQKSDKESYEKYTDGYPRNDASSDGSHQKLRGNRNIAEYSTYGIPIVEADEATEDEDATDSIRRRLNLHKGENKFEVGRDETESSKSIPEFISRLRGLSENKVSHVSKSIQPKEADEKSNVSDAELNTSHKRITDRDGTITPHDQNVRSRNEAISLNESFTINKKTKKPLVFIIDGYSVTRDKNGENKISEKTIRLRS